jgi:hypothetical protein
MRFLLAPDDGELVDWSARLHRENILPGVTTAGTFPTSSEDTAAILRSLAAGISRTSEEAENQNKIQREQLDYLKVKDAKKKNKAEKWHPTSRRLVINAASTDGDFPADEIPETYLRIINSETAGMADKEFQAQMSGTTPMDNNSPSSTDRPYQHSHHQSYLPQRQPPRRSLGTQRHHLHSRPHLDPSQ